MLDSKDPNVLELMRDVETRLAHARDKRFRMIGAVVGTVAIVALWLVPGYWTLRQAYGLPFLLLGRIYNTPKFPYFDANNLSIS